MVDARLLEVTVVILIVIIDNETITVATAVIKAAVIRTKGRTMTRIRDTSNMIKAIEIVNVVVVVHHLVIISSRAFITITIDDKKTVKGKRESTQQFVQTHAPFLVTTN